MSAAVPEDLLYSETHEWVKVEGQEALVGITHFAQEQLGDLTFVELPASGVSLAAGKEMGSVESVKAASELYSPVDGTVLAVNPDIESDPGVVNADPYGRGWMLRVALSKAPSGLLTAAQYQERVAAGH